jgi:penicillin amidase
MKVVTGVTFLLLCLVALYTISFSESITYGKHLSLTINGTNVNITRDGNGIVTVSGQERSSFYKGLGYIHAKDRGFQMTSWVIVGRGQLSEFIDPTDSNLNLDIFMRQMGLVMDATRSVARLTPKTRAILQDYVDGINYYFQKHIRSIEFMLNNLSPRVWTVEDVFIIGKLLTISKHQTNAEKFIIESLKASKRDRMLTILKKMFFPFLEQLNDKIVKHVKKLSHISSFPSELSRIIPTLGTGNHFAVLGNKSDSGFPLFASDSHTDITRLPSNWYEVTSYVNGKLLVSGITIPGFPFVFSGRNRDLSWGSSFGFADNVDFFLQECEKQSCKQGKDMYAVYRKSEWIQRKGLDPVKIFTFETTHGTLELSDPRRDSIPKGVYLSRANTYHEGGLVGTLESMFNLVDSSTVFSAQNVIKNMTLSANFLLVDKSGNIGYQQSGLVPFRRHSGLYPLLAWVKNTQWDGIVPPGDLTSVSNPYFGTISTANDDWNTDGKPLTINIHSGGYRRDRIDALLRRKSIFSRDDFTRIQNDLLSVQAIRYMKFVLPVLKSDPSLEINTHIQALSKWNYRYDVESKGAESFDRVRTEILKDIFSRITDFGALEKTDLYCEFPHYFDGIFLEYAKTLRSTLWKGETRAELVKRILNKIYLDGKKPVVPRSNVVISQFVVWARIFPKFLHSLLGINQRNILEGSATTIQRFQQIDTAVFATSYRMQVDMKESGFSTSCFGGSSELGHSSHSLGQIKDHFYKIYRNVTL